MLEKIKLIMADIFSVATTDFSMDTTMDDVPVWDSLKHMELIGALEEEFTITFSADEIVSLTGLGKIVEVVQKLIKEA